MGAAYTLGECGNDASLAILATALCSDDNESARRAGSFGLGVAGDKAVSTLIAVLDKGAEASGLVLGSAVEALGEAAMTPDPAVITALDQICWVQQQIIAEAEGDEVPVFSQDNIHTNGDLRVPVMMPLACRPVSMVLCFYLCSSIPMDVAIALTLHSTTLLVWSLDDMHADCCAIFGHFTSPDRTGAYRSALGRQYTRSYRNRHSWHSSRLGV
jgi:HEAT repeat protein